MVFLFGPSYRVVATGFYPQDREVHVSYEDNHWRPLFSSGHRESSLIALWKGVIYLIP